MKELTFRLAVPGDLPALRAMFRRITARLNAAHGEIWNDFYPNGLFPEDIENRRLYVLEGEGTLLSAMALCREAEGTDRVEWAEQGARALYFCRLGVHRAHQREGLGSLMVRHALRLAREQGAGYLRLFVAEGNTSAMAFYEKNGFVRAAGVFEEPIREGLTLRQYGYEARLP